MQTNPRWRTVTILLKTDKSLLSRQRFDRSLENWHDDAYCFTEL